MSISAIVAVYNGAPYLHEALTSILQQTKPPAELIVVDDGSTDCTPDIVQEVFAACTNVDSSQRVYLRQENQGVATALNVGIQAATGAFLAFLDADDLWTPHKLAVQWRYLQQHPTVDAVFGYAQQFISPDLSPDERANFSCPAEPQVAWIKGTGLMRAAVFSRVGLFDPTWRVGEFIDWYLRAQAAGVSMVMLDALVLHRRWHTGNLTAQSSADARVDYARIVQNARKRQHARAATPIPQQGGK